MDTDGKFEKQKAEDPFGEIKELKDVLEINGTRNLLMSEVAIGGSESSEISEEEAQNLKSTLAEIYEELGLNAPDDNAQIDISLSFSHILPKHKGKKSSRDGIKYPVTSLDLGIGWGCNYLYARVYDYENYDGYKMVNIGLNNHPMRRYLKFQGERKLSFAPVLLLVSDIIRSKIASEKEE